MALEEDRHLDPGLTVHMVVPVGAAPDRTSSVQCLVFSVLCQMSSSLCPVGCSIPKTELEFGQGSTRTGCVKTPLFSIPNLGSDKFQERVRRELIILNEFSPYHFLNFFRTKFMGTYQGCKKAACTGTALSRFH